MPSLWAHREVIMVNVAGVLAEFYFLYSLITNFWWPANVLSWLLMITGFLPDGIPWPSWSGLSRMVPDTMLLVLWVSVSLGCWGLISQAILSLMSVREHQVRPHLQEV